MGDEDSLKNQRSFFHYSIFHCYQEWWKMRWSQIVNIEESPHFSCFTTWDMGKMGLTSDRLKWHRGGYLTLDHRLPDTLWRTKLNNRVWGVQIIKKYASALESLCVGYSAGKTTKVFENFNAKQKYLWIRLVRFKTNRLVRSYSWSQTKSACL